MSSTTEAGGLAGTTTGNVSNSYAAGSATAVAAVDGIAGSSTGTISNTFWDSTKNLGISIAANTGKTTTGMNTQTTFGAWNFTDNWFMNSGSSSPVLRSLMTHNPLVPGSSPGGPTTYIKAFRGLFF